MRSRRSWLVGVGGGLGALLGFGRRVWGHPYHTTDAEVRVDAATYTLQVALRVRPEDLEEALRRRTGQRQPAEDIDPAHVIDYLHDRMRWRHDLGASDRPPLPARWVGREMEGRELWIYVDYRLPSRARELWLDHRVFFELEAEQINTVRFTGLDGERTVSLHRQGPTANLRIR